MKAPAPIQGNTVPGSNPPRLRMWIGIVATLIMWSVVPARVAIAQGAAEGERGDVVQGVPPPRDTGSATVFRQAAAQLREAHLQGQLDRGVLYGRQCLVMALPSAAFQSGMEATRSVRAACIRAARGRVGSWASAFTESSEFLAGALQADGDHRQLADYFLAGAGVRLQRMEWEEFTHDMRVLVVLARLGCNRFAFDEVTAPHVVPRIVELMNLAGDLGGYADERTEPLVSFLRSLDPHDPLQVRLAMRADTAARDAVWGELIASDASVIAAHRWVAPCLAETGAKPDLKAVRVLRDAWRLCVRDLIRHFEGSTTSGARGEPLEDAMRAIVQRAQVGSFLRRDLVRMVDLFVAARALADVRARWVGDGARRPTPKRYMRDLLHAAALWAPCAESAARTDTPEGGLPRACECTPSEEALDAVEAATRERVWALQDLHLRSLSPGAATEVRIPGMAAMLSEVGCALAHDAEAAFTAGDASRVRRRLDACMATARNLAEQRQVAYAFAAAKVLSTVADVRGRGPQGLTAEVDARLSAIAEDDPAGLIAALRNVRSQPGVGQSDPVSVVAAMLHASLRPTESASPRDEGLARHIAHAVRASKFGAWECGLDWVHLTWVLPGSEVDRFAQLFRRNSQQPMDDWGGTLHVEIEGAASRVVARAATRRALVGEVGSSAGPAPVAAGDGLNSSPPASAP